MIILQVKLHLSHVENKIGNGWQRSASKVDEWFNFQILKSNLNLRKLQIYSVTPQLGERN